VLRLQILHHQVLRPAHNPNPWIGSAVLTNHIYYSLKPYLPWAVRMGLRRFFARRVRRRHVHLWPIYPGSEQPPTYWPGWPEGKQFAVVLTHDVESPLGLANCQQVIDLETGFGFRSSFNLIPEGPYEVTAQLRQQLRACGCEVGVHDLRHDGRLYRSRRYFRRSAERINHYLAAWQAVGFRAGFMRHNLDWLHQLHIQYDASTFDTDPFEPQPTGVHTIFPFWVPAAQKPLAQLPRPNRDIEAALANPPGYVELPYTLPQDSTLFLLFREPDIDIWLRKVDWIAARGGMVLLNVHPDYLRFDGAPVSPRTYPAQHYARLLQYIRERYAGQFWHALPCQVAQYIRNAAVQTGLVARPAPTP